MKEKGGLDGVRMGLGRGWLGLAGVGLAECAMAAYFASRKQNRSFGSNQDRISALFAQHGCQQGLAVSKTPGGDAPPPLKYR